MLLSVHLLFFQDVEANTVRLKEHEQPVLVLEKSPRASTLGSIKYVFRRWISLYVHPGFYTKCNCMFSCFLQIHCDFRNTREDS